MNIKDNKVDNNGHLEIQPRWNMENGNICIYFNLTISLNE